MVGIYVMRLHKLHMCVCFKCLLRRESDACNRCVSYKYFFCFLSFYINMVVNTLKYSEVKYKNLTDVDPLSQNTNRHRLYSLTFIKRTGDLIVDVAKVFGSIVI